MSGYSEAEMQALLERVAHLERQMKTHSHEAPKVEPKEKADK